jgi:membrane fusion protein (multidrug efflux system)
MRKLPLRSSRLDFRRGSGRFRAYRGLVVAILIAPALLVGCGEGKRETVAAPPPSVTATKAEVKPVRERSQFVGRVVAVEKVELRARVQGFLKERGFTEGQQVKVGEVLFLIEPDQYQAVVQQREADLAKAEADEENARVQYARGLELVKKKNIPQSQVDELKAAESIAKASIAQAQAALDAAKLNLSYTRIVAPIAGRIGLAKYSVGNLVGPSSGPLATIVSRDPIDVQFPLTQRELLTARRSIAAKGGDPSKVIVRARLPDGTLYDRPGKLNFVDVTTNPGTDSVTLRAQFPNPAGTLVDGQYVGVVAESGEPEFAIVIPQSALQIDQQGTFVLVVDSQNKVLVRRVTTGQNIGSQVAVKSALKPGELVITEGAQKVRPGQVVSVAPAQSPEGTAAP